MSYKTGWFKRAWKKHKGSHTPSWSRSERIVQQRIRNIYGPYIGRTQRSR